MKNKSTRFESFSDLSQNILAKIFMSLNILDLVANVPGVCRSWREACFNPSLWEKINLNAIDSDLAKTPARDSFVLFDKKSSLKKMQMLKSALKFSCGSTTCLIFEYSMFLKNVNLIYISRRSHKIRRVVLPRWNEINMDGFEEAVKHWKDLECLTVPRFCDPCGMVRALGEHCKNFSELKLMCPLYLDFAKALVTHVPKLKVLSLRCTIFHKETLVHVLENLESLEALNLSHSNMVDAEGLCGDLGEIVAKASRLKSFVSCRELSYSACECPFDEKKFKDWYENKERIHSLAL